MTMMTVTMMMTMTVHHDDDDDGDWWWWGNNLTDGQGNTSGSIIKEVGDITSSSANRLIGNE
jgi:hypothetical protein